MNPCRPKALPLYGRGTPPYVILVVNAVRKRIERAGVMVSLSRARLNFAARPPTVTDVTVRACRSRSKLDNACVAFAVIIAVPVSTRVVGLYAMPIAYRP